MKRILLTLLCCAAVAGTMAQKRKTTVNNEPYPYGNPIITHMYSADPSPHVMPDGRVWLVTSVDSQTHGSFNTMHSYHTFSSDDMVNWVDHGAVFRIRDIIPFEPQSEDWALWAPDMIYHEGLYYLYYPVHISLKGHKIDNKGQRAYTGVAVSESPAGPFKVIQSMIPDTEGIDPCVFKDDDGKIYLYFGEQKVAQLADNMIHFVGKPQHLELDHDKTLLNDKKFQNMWVGQKKGARKGSKNFVEASWMQKKNGVYIFNYHTMFGKDDFKNNLDDPTRRRSNLDFSYGDSPMGPLSHGGTLNYELGVGVENGPKFPGENYVPWRLNQSNHGGVVEFHGTDYLFYHTSALSSWRQDAFKAQGTNAQRSVCVDVINYDERGLPLPVKQTLESVPAVKVDQPFEIALGESVELKGGVACLKNVDLGSGYYYFDFMVENPAKGALEVRLDAPDGMLVGTALLNVQKFNKREGLFDTFIRDAKGKRDIYLVWRGEKDPQRVVKPRFFAGSPRKVK